MNPRIFFPLLGLLFLYTSASQLDAQFFRIYGYATQDAQGKELVYWNTVVPASDQQYNFFGEMAERKGLMAHSLEIEYGLTPNLTVAAYADFEQPGNKPLRFTGVKAVMAYYRFYDKNVMPVDVALYAEYKFPRKEYKDAEELEVKLIMEKDLGFHTLVVNPTFEKKVSGPEIAEGLEFALNAAYYYRQSLVIQPGLEYYSKMGELREISPFDNQANYLFPCFDLYFGKFGQFRWHAGVGFGLTDPTDDVVIKNILSWEFF